MVQAWVGHFLTPLKCTYNEYDWRVTSQKPHKKSLWWWSRSPLQIQWTHAAWGVGGLAHDRSDAFVEAIQ